MSRHCILKSPLELHRTRRGHAAQDKAAAKRIARKYESDAALREGVIDPMLDSISRKSRLSIDAHLTDYENKLRGRRAE